MDLVLARACPFWGYGASYRRTRDNTTCTYNQLEARLEHVQPAVERSTVDEGELVAELPADDAVPIPVEPAPSRCMRPPSTGPASKSTQEYGARLESRTQPVPVAATLSETQGRFL